MCLIFNCLLYLDISSICILFHTLGLGVITQIYEEYHLFKLFPNCPCQVEEREGWHEVDHVTVRNPKIHTLILTQFYFPTWLILFFSSLTIDNALYQYEKITVAHSKSLLFYNPERLAKENQVSFIQSLLEVVEIGQLWIWNCVFSLFQVKNTMIHSTNSTSLVVYFTRLKVMII